MFTLAGCAPLRPRDCCCATFSVRRAATHVYEPKSLR